MSAAVAAALPGTVIGMVPPGVFRIKRSSTEGDFSSAEIATLTAAILAVPDLTPQLEAANAIANWAIAERAFALALIDELNVIRAALPSPLPPITPAQAIQRIRSKAGTL